MEKQKRWHRYLIFVVIALTVFNILPTVFFYSKPLKDPIDEKRANTVALATLERTNALEEQSISWLSSFCDLLNVKPSSIALEKDQSQFVKLIFKTSEDAAKFRAQLPRAGALIPFVPAELSLYETGADPTSKQVIVQRRIPIHFDPASAKTFFQFSTKFDEQNTPTPLYRALIQDRALQIGVSLGGNSENAQMAQAVQLSGNQTITPQNQELVYFLAQNVLSFVKTFGENSAISQRYFASFTQIDAPNKQEFAQHFIRAVEQSKDAARLEKAALQEESRSKQAQGLFLDPVKQQKLDQLAVREKNLASAEVILKRHLSNLASGKTPWNYTTLGAKIQESSAQINGKNHIQVFSLDGRHPFIDQIAIDWTNQKLALVLYPDVIAFKEKLTKTPSQMAMSDQLDQFLYNEIAFLSRQSGEKVIPFQNQFEIALTELPGSQSFLAMRLGSIASAQSEQVKQALLNIWNPTHPDLTKQNFPVWDFETYAKLPAEQQKLGLVIYAPAVMNKTVPPKGFRTNSIYVIAKGMDRILQKVRETPQAESSQQFIKDFQKLQTILQQNGFMGYSGASYAMSKEFAADFIFENENYFQPVLKATREDFSVYGTKRYAILEFTDVEQRILTENKIDTRIHEELLKWRDDYNAAQLNIKGVSKYDVPKPAQSPLWSNFKLSFVKYFRGDDRKILHWGLDLSGGKTVLIELRDTNNRVVTDEVDIKQGINELYKRVNKMGVSEVSIRQEGNFIALDFPGSQGLSATDLVKASSMSFHVVNEKFSLNNGTLGQTVNAFLQDVWNEASVTNRKTAEEINLIAWKQIHGDSFDPEVIQPRSEAARILYENGLRLTSPQDTNASSNFNDAISKVALFRGSDFTDWHGQTHPLMFVFRNYALEGSNLDNVQASYDPSKGNFLSFSIRGSQTTKDGQSLSPRDDLFAWTSPFSKEKVMGTPNASYSDNKGWRMAVILNGSVISAPTLDSPLRDSAMISGSFSQREVNQLEADLKAGSLSFTPRILSEKNVSPELGNHERLLGIVAMIIALGLVIAAMVGYYRFGGVVASGAVVLNLFIMWAALQNIGATLTLANIAGVVLTLGMAVDANVLVFERIREEFAVTGRIASAIHAGYKKAFSAIIDSNITTVIAALILLNFDAGPIKGLAVTLIIGIVASMFTALFMTRTFFAAWVQNPAHKSLNMRQWIKATHFDFLKWTKPTLIFSTIVILVGIGCFATQRQTLLGMDFTGGYALTIELASQGKEQQMRSSVEKALIAQGASAQEIQVRELNDTRALRIFLGRSMDQPGHPFYGMPLGLEVHGLPYENNPKIVWIVRALQTHNLSLQPESLANLEQNWAELSGQMSSNMRNQAIIGLSLALLCILIYITMRFEFKYAISATLCLAHDIVFTVAAIAILYALRVPVQIDLNTVAALMTIVGYSLNDTIIVFDRIREDVRTMRKSTFTHIINHALNITLSRTVMTSGTTLLALLPLVALGGSTIFGFALVMIIGVIFGTFSSLFIAAPLMHYFHKKEMEKEQKGYAITQSNGI